MTEGPYVRTYTGKKLHFLSPSPEEIDLEDIAHGLSLENRWGGSGRFFFSVGQHSLNACSWVRTEREATILGKPWIAGNRTFALQALLHDSAEAYMKDMPRPIKRELKEYSILEDRLRQVIFAKIGLPVDIAGVVKEADEVMQHTEAAKLLNFHPDWYNPDKVDHAILTMVEKKEPEKVEQEFVEMYLTLI